MGEQSSVSIASGSDLKRSLGPVLLWGLGVGYVISGMYFGWNLGLVEAGPYGMLLATAVVTAMYVCFVLGYAELACAIPRAGGAFVYAHRALGPRLGFLAGLAQLIEFVFAPPAIAAAIGAYMNLFFPDVPPIRIALVAYGIFTWINAWGVRQSASIELVVTVVAVGELLLFAGVAGSAFRWDAFASEPLPGGWAGAFRAIPFAVWFYLAIEGVANVAEEAESPQRDVARGFLSAMGTLVVLAILVLFAAVGVAGWRAAVYAPGSTTASDSPLPLVMRHVVGGDHALYHLLVGVGLCGLVASFHGIILVAGRAMLELGRVGYAPSRLGATHPTFKTPVNALLVNLVLGAVALFTGKTSEIITISVFGALTLYVLATASVFRLRRIAPDLPRPFRTPGYPVVPAVALALAVVCLAALTASNLGLAGVYVGLLAAGFLYYALGITPDARERAMARLGTPHDEGP
jgi:ethanolamine permease